MPILARAPLCLVFLIVAAGCGYSSLPAGADLMARSRQAWQGDWHGVWQIEWSGAPVRGPLVAEVWHMADGRLRIETLEVPVPTLSGLVLVQNGKANSLYSMRDNQVEPGPPGRPLRIPLISDALDTMDWLFDRLEGATLVVAGHERLESGPATHLKITLSNGDRAVLWINDETGLPARLQMNSATWGEAIFSARALNRLEGPHPGLFDIEAQSLRLTPLRFIIPTWIGYISLCFCRPPLPIGGTL